MPLIYWEAITVGVTGYVENSLVAWGWHYRDSGCCRRCRCCADAAAVQTPLLCRRRRPLSRSRCAPPPARSAAASQPAGGPARCISSRGAGRPSTLHFSSPLPAPCHPTPPTPTHGTHHTATPTHLQDVVLRHGGHHPLVVAVPGKVGDLGGVPPVDEQQLGGAVLSVLRGLRGSRRVGGGWRGERGGGDSLSGGAGMQGGRQVGRRAGRQAGWHAAGRRRDVHPHTCPPHPPPHPPPPPPAPLRCATGPTSSAAGQRQTKPGSSRCAGSTQPV